MQIAVPENLMHCQAMLYTLSITNMLNLKPSFSKSPKKNLTMTEFKLKPFQEF